MSNAFETASLISQHFDKGLLSERKPGYDYIAKVLEDKGIYNHIIFLIEKKNNLNTNIC